MNSVILYSILAVIIVISDIIVPILVYRTRDIKFVKSSLKTDEKILAIAKTSWVIMLLILILQLMITALCVMIIYFEDICSGWEPIAIIAFACFLLVPLFKLCVSWLREYVVTNNRIIIKRGIISRNTKELRFGKVESCEVEQGILGRLFGYGEICVKGTGGNEDSEYYIDNPLKFRQYIVALIDNEIKTQNNKEQTDNSIPKYNSIEELREYKKLLDEGIISKEDFDKKKQEILDRK